MTGSETLTYFLFPHMTLSASDFRNLCIFLPRLNVLEIARQASIPEWAQGKISPWQVLSGEELSSRIVSCLEGYRAFAQVHGGPGGVLGFLNQALNEIDEPRYRIQEELRGKCRPEGGGLRTEGGGLSHESLQAALFLEIARELDDKELEIESGYSRLNSMEQEFREILGIGDEESEWSETGLTPALAPDTNGLLYMLSKRIGSWFQMISLKPLETMPVFVACFPEVIEEVMEMVRTGKNPPCPPGKELSTATHLLGSIPKMDGLGGKQFRSLIESPEASELLSSCHRDLEGFITSAARGQEATGLEDKRRWLQSSFERFCQKCEAFENGKIDILLTVTNVSLTGAPGLFLNTVKAQD